MDIFDSCARVNDLLNSGNEFAARNELIKAIDYCEREGIPYDPLINHLLRETGLYPYIKSESALWMDRFACEAFKVNVGLKEPVVLHREQSRVLKKLLDGDNIALSAPTSFGKSFIVDAFIALKEPKNVVIIVPTTALTDETRRRLTRKFSDRYKIITTTGVELSDRNIFIFPQERAISYADRIADLDMLIIDEFYKAGEEFDKDRAPSLLRAILELGGKARQRYFLAPNISSLAESPLFTDGIDFVELKFNTVYLEMNDLHKDIAGDETLKGKVLLQILKDHQGEKTLIYAGTYSNIAKIGNLIVDAFPTMECHLLQSFHQWLSENYSKSWSLTNLIKRGVGVHSGELHRALGQLQIKLFDESDGLNIIISTSSIVKGVNTCAENVVLWRSKKGSSNLDDFTFKNIVGRGGRMFKHFVGKVFILEKPPASEPIQLELTIPDELLGNINENVVGEQLEPVDLERIRAFKKEMFDLVGSEVFSELQRGSSLQTTSSSLHRTIAVQLKNDPNTWKRLSWLNSENPGDWEWSLYKVIQLDPGGWDVRYRPFVGFVKVLSGNWYRSIPEMLADLDDLDIGIEEFFKLERSVAFRLSALLNDLNVLQKKLCVQNGVDISSFVAKTSSAFLPPVVYQLEEYGLPRMISKKIHKAGVVNFTAVETTLHGTLSRMRQLGVDGLLSAVSDLSDFESYIVRYFFEGIRPDPQLLH